MSILSNLSGNLAAMKILNKKGARIHFVGVLGAGMLPLSKLLSHFGACIFGSDRDYRAEHRLKYPHISFAPLGTYPAPDLVVYSLAVGADNPELKLALDRGIPTVSRPEALGAIMQKYTHRIGIAGTHGKSTTTALVHTALSSLGRAPTTLSGAKLPCADALSVGGDDYFVFEACEYRDAFLNTSPTGAVITNIEMDHTDYFKSEEQLYGSFFSFANKCCEHILIGGDTPLSRRLADNLPFAYSYGRSGECDFVVRDVGTSEGTRFLLSLHDRPLGEFKIGAIGEHNALNAAAALALAYLYGADLSGLCDAFSGFLGIERRLELLGYIGGRAVYYDYAHHPTEIKASLKAVKQRHGCTTVIFRPHTFSRTDALFSDFVAALTLANFAVILDVYAAREEKENRRGSRELADALSYGIYLDICDAVSYTINKTHGAIVLMGAGEVEAVKNELLGLLDG